MCSSITIILIIVSYACVIHAATESNDDDVDFGWQEIEQLNLDKKAPKNCVVKIPLLDNYGFMPVPFGGNFSKADKTMHHSFKELNPPLSNPKIVRPDGEGLMTFIHDNSYKLSCTKEKFVLPPNIVTDTPLHEITIKCFDGTFEYKGDQYKFTKFKCNNIPLATLIETESPCQGQTSNRIFKIGFQSSDYFVNLYRVCFDKNKKSVLYAWHYLDSPMYRFTQITQLKPTFIKTNKYDPIDLEEEYKNQKRFSKLDTHMNQLEEIYEDSDDIKRFFLVPGQLISELEYSYVAERHSTFFYENSAPQWSTFNNYIWKDVQKAFRRHLIKSFTKHLVVTGTLTIKGSNNTSKHDDYRLFMSSKSKIPIPDYFWKLDYNYNNAKSAVYIAMNNPYKIIDHNIKICKPIPCPGRSLSYLNKKSKLFYCCTKESFEKIFGTIDPIVFKEF